MAEPTPDPDLISKIVAASNAIYEHTLRDHNRRNTIFVTYGSPLYEAIQRGEMSAFGIEPGSGVLVDAGIDPATGKSAGTLLRIDTPEPPSAVDRLAWLAIGRSNQT